MSWRTGIAMVMSEATWAPSVAARLTRALGDLAQGEQLVHHRTACRRGWPARRRTTAFTATAP
jgi:hypothetical protein